jgi:hypothetical protein
MKTFNITGLIYFKLDSSKQTLFMNEIIKARCEYEAKILFRNKLESAYEVVKIYSVEEISKEAA